MGELNAHGVAVDVPPGWDGRIFRRPEHDELAAQSADGAPAPPGARTHSVTHISSVPLHEGIADFGSDAAEQLGADDALIVLFEYEPTSVGTAMFAAQGLSRELDPDGFSGNVLQRTLPNQAGVQHFFSEQQRAFCLYVVLGSYDRRHDVVPRVNAVLETIRIEPLMPPPETTTTQAAEPATTLPAGTTTTLPADAPETTTTQPSEPPPPTQAPGAAPPSS